VLEVNARRVQRAVPQELLDGVQRRAALHLAERPSVSHPCGWTRFSIPALAARRLHNVLT
jgi:hypothetical protein